MDFGLTPEQDELREAVVGFARSRLADQDAGGGFRRDLWEACAEFGVLALPVPTEYGGSAHGVVTTAMAMEALGYGGADQGLLFAIHAHMWSVLMPVLSFGTDDQKAAYVPKLIDGRLVGAHGMSEPGSGSDAFALSTRAARDGDDYVLTGTKTFVSNAPVADVFLVFATVAPERGMWGVTAFLIDKDTPGLSVTTPFRKLGLHGSPMSEVVLDACRVPASARLGAEGQGGRIFTHSMAWERACILASQVGRMARQLDDALAYTRERKQFGRPVRDFQLVAARLADMKVRLEAARLLLYRAAWQHERGEDARLEAAIAKLFVSEAAVQSALDAIQVHGGYGYMEEYRVEADLRDAVGGTLYSGTSEIQRMMIARHLGCDPQ